MSTYLALDATTGDLILPAGGGVSRVDKGRFVVQQVQSKLRAQLGEWLLDTSIGWLSPQDYEKNYDRPGLEARAREIILGTQGVQAILSLQTTFSNRTLTLQFKATTIYGNIDLTIPWGVS